MSGSVIFTHLQDDPPIGSQAGECALLEEKHLVVDGGLVDWVVGLIGWLVGWFNWFVGWLVGWLVG